MEHQNAEIFRAIADGRLEDITYTAPWIDGEDPLSGCSSSIIFELHNPGRLTPPGIKFHVKDLKND